MARRSGMGEFSSSSLADIAFLLLIFFLVTTTMDVDSGISRRLPPPVEDEPEDTPPIKDRNVFIVLINTNNDLMVEGKPMNIRKLKEEAKKFITNKNNEEGLPEMLSLVEMRERAIEKGKGKEAAVFEKARLKFGNMSMAKMAVVSLQNDRGTSFNTYIEVYNELIAAYNELRDELSMRAWGKKYDDLKESQRDLVKKIYPQRISEAEPKNIGDN